MHNWAENRSIRRKKENYNVLLEVLYLFLRRKRDSNPRSRNCGTTDFESAPIDHSGISPKKTEKIYKRKMI